MSAVMRVVLHRSLRSRRRPLGVAMARSPGARVRAGQGCENVDGFADVAVDGEYEPSPAQWVREQVELYESSGGTEGTTLWDTGLPVVILTTRGAKSGRIRKVPLMRVEHGGRYAAVASKGGFPRHPVWYFNVTSDPHVELQGGSVRQDMTAPEITGDLIDAA